MNEEQSQKPFFRRLHHEQPFRRHSLLRTAAHVPQNDMAPAIGPATERRSLCGFPMYIRTAMALGGTGIVVPAGRDIESTACYPVWMSVRGARI